MPIYDIDYTIQTGNLLPPNKRKPKYLAWLIVLTYPIQWLRNIFFSEYTEGSTAPFWVIHNNYAIGDRVRNASDHGVYECIVAIVNDLIQPSSDPARWIKIADNYVGVREREKYTGQKLSLEFALNKWFRTTFNQPPGTPDIYITNNVLKVFPFIVGGLESNSSSVVSDELFADSFIVDDYNFGVPAFTIFIPVAVWTALSSNAAARDPIVRSFANKYVIAGMTYDIQTY